MWNTTQLDQQMHEALKVHGPAAILEALVGACRQNASVESNNQQRLTERRWLETAHAIERAWFATPSTL